MFIFIIWKVSISGWTKEIFAVFDDEKKAREYIETLSGGTQHQFNIEKKKVN